MSRAWMKAVTKNKKLKVGPAPMLGRMNWRKKHYERWSLMTCQFSPCLHNILRNGALFLVGTVHKVSGSVQNRGRSSFHFLSIAMFPIPVSRFCPIISLFFSCTCGDCTYGTKEGRFNADVKGATANNGENTTIKQYLRQHLYPMRAKLAGRERGHYSHSFQSPWDWPLLCKPFTYSEVYGRTHE